LEHWKQRLDKSKTDPEDRPPLKVESEKKQAVSSPRPSSPPSSPGSSTPTPTEVPKKPEINKEGKTSLRKKKIKKIDKPIIFV